MKSHIPRTSVDTGARTRRGFIASCAAALAGVAWLATRRGHAATTPAKGGTVTIVPFTAAGVKQAPVPMPRVVKSDAEWQKQLSPTEFAVTRQEGTERAYTGKTWDNHEDGLYRCICCDTALYDSKTKYESGTGWPSFWTVLAKENVVETQDRSMLMARTAVSCARCDAHLGHVFDDGPRPTGLRYCMNSAAMKFVKRA